MTQLIDFEHAHGDKAITINKITYPVAMAVSNHIQKYEDFYQAVQDAMDEGNSEHLAEAVFEATKKLKEAW